MRILARVFLGTLAVSLLGFVPQLCAAENSVVSHSQDLAMVPPTRLPAVAQQPGIALQLYTASGNGICYLYIEQQEGQRLLALDVTDPAKIKLAGDVPLTTPGPFDFVRPIGVTAYLVRFRINLGLGVLDLRKPKVPSLHVLSAAESQSHAESLGGAAFLLAKEPPRTVPPVPRDNQVFDVSNPASPALLGTVRQVTGETAREETGTTFLLGADGLTVLRHPRLEEAYKARESYTN
jgi:hypothetical protein